jgi:hypothetical protein
MLGPFGNASNLKLGAEYKDAKAVLSDPRKLDNRLCFAGCRSESSVPCTESIWFDAIVNLCPREFGAGKPGKPGGPGREVFHGGRSIPLPATPGP